MPEAAWPFLIGRARNEDYRFVVIPEIMTDPPLAAVLRASTSGDPSDPGTALVREIQVTAEGVPVTVVYQVRIARAEDYGIPGDGLLTDANGRPILLTEGLATRNSASSVMESRMPQEALDQAHDLVVPAFQRFWARGDGFTREVGQPFTIAAASSPGSWLRLDLTGLAAQVEPPEPDASTVPDPGVASVLLGRPVEAQQNRGALRTVPGSRGRWAIVAFALAAILLVVLVLAGVALLAGHILAPGPHHPTASTLATRPSIKRPTSGTRTAAQTMAELCDALQSGRPQAAYSLTATTYQVGIAEREFASELLPQGGAPANCTYRLQTVPANTASARMTVTQHRASTSWIVTLILKGGKQWQVASISRQ